MDRHCLGSSVPAITETTSVRHTACLTNGISYEYIFYLHFNTLKWYMKSKNHVEKTRQMSL